jgi:hypothetical protein
MMAACWVIYRSAVVAACDRRLLSAAARTGPMLNPILVPSWTPTRWVTGCRRIAVRALKRQLVNE